MKKYIAEFIGTFTLVLFGTGVAVITGNIVAIALAFGLAIIASAYVIGDISGCHVNPAVSLAMLIDKRMTVKDFIGYVVSQILGAIAGSATLLFIAKQLKIDEVILGANTFGKLTMIGAFVVELILTFIFIYTVLGVTKDKEKSNIAPIVIGLTLTFVHLFGIGLTGTSVNPARSLAPALLQGGDALKQVWLFIVAPLAGGGLAAIVFKFLNSNK